MENEISEQIEEATHYDIQDLTEEDILECDEFSGNNIVHEVVDLVL